MVYVSAATNTRPAHPPRPKTLPHMVVKNGTILHVYAKTADHHPVATYDRVGQWWVRRLPDGQEQRTKSITDALRQVNSEVHP